MAADPSKGATATFTEGHRRNIYSVPDIRWSAFLHPPAGLGMLLRFYADDRSTASEEVEERDHIWDNGGQGCVFGGSWLAATADTPLSFAGPMSFVVEDPHDPKSTWVRDLLRYGSPRLTLPDPGTCGDVDFDLSFGLGWRCKHLRTNSHRIRISPGEVTGRWQIEWEGASATGLA